MIIACLKWGHKYPSEYVNILADMVARSTTKPHKFVCFTDDPEGIDPHIHTEALPGELKGWWNKLWLFKKGVLEGRVLFLDLDTIITGNLDPFLEYSGDFALLRDFYRDGYGSGVMVWNGDHSHIWDDYVKAGYPVLSGGDQAWIENYDAQLLQDLYPGKIVSYKVHAREWPPDGASIVCFHGNPNPHDYPSKWIEQVWRKGGLSAVMTDPKSNVSRGTVIKNIRENIKLDVPWMRDGSTSKSMILVGGGPSMKFQLPQIRLRRKNGELWAMNNTHDFLVERGIIPDYFVMLDARPENVEFVRKPNKKTVYYIASRCDPSVFEALKGFNVVMWHSYITDAQGVDKEAVELLNGRPWRMIGGGGTVGLRAMYLGRFLGYKKFHIFGYDSSYENGEHHAYSQSLNDGERILNVTLGDKTFLCAPWMAQQARDFQSHYIKLLDQGCHIKVYGDGLIPHIWRHHARSAESHTQL